MSEGGHGSVFSPAALLVGLAVALVGALFTWEAAASDRLAAQERFESVATSTVMAIESELDMVAARLHAVHSLLDVDPELTQEEFEHHLDLALPISGILATGAAVLTDDGYPVTLFHAPGYDVDWTGTDLAEKRRFRETIERASHLDGPAATHFMAMEELPTRSALLVMVHDHADVATFAVLNADRLVAGLPDELTALAAISVNQSTQLPAPGVTSLSRTVGFADRLWTVDLNATDPGLIPSQDTLTLGFLMTIAFAILGMLLTGGWAQRRRLRDDVDENTRINEAREQFIASVSHEVRTPLTAVVGFAELLATAWDDMSEQERRELVGQIAEQSAEVTSLVADLLVGSRADISTLHLDLQPITLLESIRRALASIPGDLKRQIDVGFDDDRTWVADPGRVAQIIRNLVVNALKYGGDGVWIESRRMPHSVILSVVDDGDGVPDDFVAAMFEPFRSLAGAHQALPSVGLGLHVSASLARAMGGSVTYRRRGDLTAFDLELPAATVDRWEASSVRAMPPAS